VVSKSVVSSIEEIRDEDGIGEVGGAVEQT